MTLITQKMKYWMGHRNISKLSKSTPWHLESTKITISKSSQRKTSKKLNLLSNIKIYLIEWKLTMLKTLNTDFIEKLWFRARLKMSYKLISYWRYSLFLRNSLLYLICRWLRRSRNSLWLQLTRQLGQWMRWTLI